MIEINTAGMLIVAVMMIMIPAIMSIALKISKPNPTKINPFAKMQTPSIPRRIAGIGNRIFSHKIIPAQISKLPKILTSMNLADKRDLYN